MTTSDTENSDELLTQTNRAETRKKNFRFAVVVYVACVFGGVLVSGWQKTLAGSSVVPITTLAFQLGVAVVPFVFGWLIAKGLSLALKNVSFNTVWAVSAATLVLAAIFGQQSAEISTAASGGNTVQVQPTANKVEQVSTEIEAKCVDAYKKEQYEMAHLACASAAEGGNATAQATLGDMYTHGYGVVQDHIAAVRWYSLAAQQGSARAQWILGNKYREGKGVAQDHTQAMYWYRLAASQRINPTTQGLAQYDIGMIYKNGLGVPQDFVRAHMWLNISAATGGGFSAHARDILASKMTREQISEAQKMATECLARNYKAC